MINLENTQVFETPWKHIIINDIFDSETASILSNNENLKIYMHNWETPFLRKELNASQMVSMTDMPPECGESLLDLNESEELINLLHNTFMDNLLSAYPKKDEAYFRNGTVRSQYGAYNFGDEECSADALGTHIDNGKKIYSGLIYFKESDDTVKGSDFILESYDASGNLVEEKVIEYGNNFALIWACTPDCWHRVTPRGASPNNLRRFINFVYEREESLHDYHSKDGYGWKLVRVAT